MRRRFARIAAITALALLFLCTIHSAWAADMGSEELRMLALVNQERAARGLSILKPDPRMTDLARQHSQEMIDFKYFAHESPVSGGLLNRVLAARIEGWLIAGENLAGAPGVEIAHDALMKSEKHKENILNGQYTHLGIGIIDGGPYGKMFSQEFVGYKNVAPESYASSVQGRVVDRLGRPITGAAIRINGTVIPTNHNGEFRFTLVQPGVYTIFYDAAGFFSQTQEGITVNPGETARPPLVIMTPASGQTIASNSAGQQTVEVASRTERNQLAPRVKIRRARGRRR